MYALIDQLKEARIPVGLLSNVDERWAKLLRSSGLYQPFDPCLLSCEIDAWKPAPRAFEILLEKMTFPAGDIVFIDDLAENVEAAKRAGLDAIIFESSEQIKRELSKRGLLLTWLES